jgi:hypothetical protein
MRTLLTILATLGTAACGAAISDVDGSDAELLSGGSSLCQPDVRASEERMLRAFVAGAYSEPPARKSRCRIA